MMRDRLPRRGVSMMWALVIITVLAMMAATAAWQCMAGRSGIDQRQHQMEALWLARSGAELAAEQLRANSEYQGETVALHPDTTCVITVTKEADGRFRIHSIARSPESGPGSVSREITRMAIKTGDPATIKLDLETANQNNP
jgi:type II secretory pathway component PulK